MFKIEILTQDDKIIAWDTEPNEAFPSYAHVKGAAVLKASRLLDEEDDIIDSYGEFPPKLKARGTRTSAKDA